jgi:N-succinyldiaminopimelate aminotransferase
VRRAAPARADVYARTNALAEQFAAVNLGPGTPDFDGPPVLLAGAARAVRGGPNQYAPPAGLPGLRESIARYAGLRGLDYDPDSEITVTAGCTEALASAIMSIVRPGDEVLALEPCYDYYPGLVALAGGRLVLAPLREVAGGYQVDPALLERAVSPRTRLLLINTPHNPTGHVLSAGEIAAVAELARRHDLVVLTDEVYQDLTYGPAHVSPAAGLRERAIVCSSASKVLSVCGWRVGWALAPPSLTAGLRQVHRHLTCCAPTPLQAAVAGGLDWALRSGYLGQLRDGYARRRDVLLTGLREAGWSPAPPEGGFVILARSPAWLPADPLEANQLLATACGVVGLPVTPFFGHPRRADGMLRFAFCKELPVIQEAARRLAQLPSAPPADPRPISMETP